MMTTKELLEKWCPVGNISGSPDFIQVKILKINDDNSFDAEIIVAHHCSWREDCSYNAEDYYPPKSIQTWVHLFDNMWNAKDSSYENTVMHIFDESDKYSVNMPMGASFGK